ncbi:MAG: MYG1 family protein [Candidatus Paceibacterota bacterium]
MMKVVTHSGSFHADDVFAVATLQLHFGVENVEVVRTRDESIIASADIVLDVGGVYDPEQQRYDHHQNGAPVRENGIPYAAFGLIWKHYGEELARSTAIVKRIEESLVLPIDAGDNGVDLFSVNEHGIGPVTIQSILALLRPEWGSAEDVNKAFLDACTLARTVIERAIAHSEAEVEEEKVARAAYETAPDKHVIISDQPISPHFFVEYLEPLFIVCPDDPVMNNNWEATAVRIRKDDFASRVQFPERWAGLRGDELAAASGIADAVFCHKARFYFVAGSKEGVLAAVEKTLLE